MDFFDFSTVNIGSLIQDRLKKSSITGAKLARLVNMDQSNLNKLLQKGTLDTEKIIKFSKALKYNFFMEYSPDEQYKILKDDNFRISDDIYIGQIIKLIIQKQGLTYDELCEVLMKQDPSYVIRKSDIAKLINRKSLDSSKLSRFCDALNINFFEFYCMDAHLTKNWISHNLMYPPGVPGIYNREEYFYPAFGLIPPSAEKVEEDTGILNQLIKAKSDLAVLEFKYKILQKRLIDAGLPWDVDDVQ